MPTADESSRSRPERPRVSKRPKLIDRGLPCPAASAFFNGGRCGTEAVQAVPVCVRLFYIVVIADKRRRPSRPGLLPLIVLVRQTLGMGDGGACGSMAGKCAGTRVLRISWKTPIKTDFPSMAKRCGPMVVSLISWNSVTVGSVTDALRPGLAAQTAAVAAIKGD